MATVARCVLRTIAIASLFAAGCSSSAAVCPCPAPGIGRVTVPAAPANPIVSVSADPPCTAMDSGSGTVYLQRQDSGVCRGRAQLANGDTYAFAVEFRASGTGCCGSLAYAVDASAPMLIDAGAD